MPAVARLGDMEVCHCSVPFREGHFRAVFANGIAMSGVGHLNTIHLLPCPCPACCCPHKMPLMAGSPNVFAEGIPVGRVGDPTCTAVAQGSPSVFANGAGGGRAGEAAASSLSTSVAKQAGGHPIWGQT